MDESKIVATLAARANVQIAPSLPEVTAPKLTPDEALSSKLPDAAPPDPLLLFRLFDFFNVSTGNREDGDVQAKLVSIFDWAKQKTGTDDHLAGMEAIRGLEGQLGLTYKGSEKIDSLYRYIKLDGERLRVEREMALVGGY